MPPAARRVAGRAGALALLLTLLCGGLPGAAQATAITVPDPAPASASAPRTGVDLGVYQTRLLRLINRQRSSRHLHPVRRVSPCVDHLSEKWAAHLASTGELVHRDQHVVLDRCHMHWAGEALVRGTALTPTAAVSAWMHSPEHRAILLKGRANRAGVGVRIDLEGRIVAVLNFTDTRA